MIGIIICTENENYNGIYQLSCLAEYIDNKKIGNDVKTFMNNYVDEESQLIIFTAYSLYDAKELSEKISKKFENTQIIIFSDENESIDENLAEFIGYDVCADDYYTSPIGMGYLGEIDEFNKFEDEPFFDNLSNEVRFEYFEQLNDYGIFNDLIPAGEIAEYCNWLIDEEYDVFQGAKKFKIVKIYLA
ncbi:MAG: hypothetical protein ACLUFN_06355 [Eubacterium sp.]